MSQSGSRTCLTAATTIPDISGAQSYPSRPIRLIVPFAARGPSDSAARTLGEALSKRLDQAFVIENRPGADGLLAGQSVLSAPADGQTLLFHGSSLIPLPLLKSPPPFDLLTDLAPVSMTTLLEWALYVSPHVPAKSIAELVEYARANPGKLSYATSNFSERLASEQFLKTAGIEMVRVPYKGFAQVLPDLMAARVHMNVAPLSAVLPYAKDGRVRLLAVLTLQRSRFAPDVSTLREAGVAHGPIPGWQAVFAPAKTPTAIIDRLNFEIGQSLLDTHVVMQFERLSTQVHGSTVEELAGTIRDDVRTWSEFIRQYAIAAE